jgi:hypothetical protein
MFLYHCRWRGCRDRDRMVVGFTTIIYLHHINNTKKHNTILLNHRISEIIIKTTFIKGNAKRGVSPRLKIWPGDLDLWPWKSIGFQILLRTKYVQSLVKIHCRMLILEWSQGCYGMKDEQSTHIILKAYVTPSLRVLLSPRQRSCEGI